jgi:hypothetical protein
VMTAIRRSRRFVLIDTVGARRSKWVGREIGAVLGKRSPGVISIRIGDTSDGRPWPFVSDESLWARIDEFNWEHEPAGASLDGNPSEKVVERIRSARSNIRARAMFRNAAGTLVLVLTGLLIFSVFQTRLAIAQREQPRVRRWYSWSTYAPIPSKSGFAVFRFSLQQRSRSRDHPTQTPRCATWRKKSAPNSVCSHAPRHPSAGPGKRSHPTSLISAIARIRRTHSRSSASGTTPSPSGQPSTC